MKSWLAMLALIIIGCLWGVKWMYDQELKHLKRDVPAEVSKP